MDEATRVRPDSQPGGRRARRQGTHEWRREAIQLASNLTVWLFHLEEHYVVAAGAFGTLAETTSHTVRCLPVLHEAINCLRSVCSVFVEIVGGYALSADRRHRPTVQTVGRKATRIILNLHDPPPGLLELPNDLPINLPAVTARGTGLPIGKAFAQVVELANADMREFVAMSDQPLAMETNRFVRLYVATG